MLMAAPVLASFSRRIFYLKHFKEIASPFPFCSSVSSGETEALRSTLEQAGSQKSLQSLGLVLCAGIREFSQHHSPL